MLRQYVSSIFDLIIYPVEELYEIKDVNLIFHTRKGEVKKPLLVEGKPQFKEDYLHKWIINRRLEYETKTNSNGSD